MRARGFNEAKIVEQSRKRTEKETNVGRKEREWKSERCRGVRREKGTLAPRISIHPAPVFPPRWRTGGVHARRVSRIHFSSGS